MNVLDDAPAAVKAQPPRGGTLCCRTARSDDARECAPLVFASGEHEFRYFLGVSPERCIEFLSVAFGSTAGRFSWRRHSVAVDGSGVVVGVLAFHDGRSIRWDDASVVWMLTRHFGIWRAAQILLRGLALQKELPKPARDQTLMAHCAIAESMRGRGIFTALFRYATSDQPTGDFDRSLVLDVLVTNDTARTLYERLGFVAQSPARRPRSPRLPVELCSIRMSRACRLDA